MVSVGETLRQVRESKGITLLEIEKNIRIRQKFLQAVEKSDWEYFSSKIYIIGVIKSYANYLGIDSKKLLAFFRRDYERIEEVRFKRKIKSDLLTPETKKVVLVFVGLIIVFFIVYFGYQVKQFVAAPKVVLISPTVTNFSQEDRVKIIGKTEKDAAVTIFGERVYQNKEGIFEFSLPLSKGVNELVIEVIGANGKKTVIKRSFIRS